MIASKLGAAEVLEKECLEVLPAEGCWRGRFLEGGRIREDYEDYPGYTTA
jgi:hypothetical protein